MGFGRFVPLSMWAIHWSWKLLACTKVTQNFATARKKVIGWRTMKGTKDVEQENVKKKFQGKSKPMATAKKVCGAKKNSRWWVDKAKWPQTCPQTNNKWQSCDCCFVHGEKKVNLLILLKEHVHMETCGKYVAYWNFLPFFCVLLLLGWPDRWCVTVALWQPIACCPLPIAHCIFAEKNPYGTTFFPLQQKISYLPKKSLWDHFFPSQKNNSYFSKKTPPFHFRGGNSYLSKKSACGTYALISSYDPRTFAMIVVIQMITNE